jgi:hypothetical protein
MKYMPQKLYHWKAFLHKNIMIQYRFCRHKIHILLIKIHILLIKKATPGSPIPHITKHNSHVNNTGITSGKCIHVAFKKAFNEGCTLNLYLNTSSKNSNSCSYPLKPSVSTSSSSVKRIVWFFQSVSSQGQPS